MNKRQEERSHTMMGHIRLKFHNGAIYTFPILDISASGMRILYNWNTLEILYGGDFIKKGERFDMFLIFDNLPNELKGEVEVVRVIEIEEITEAYEIGLKIVNFEPLVKDTIKRLVSEENTIYKKQLVYINRWIDSLTV